MMILKRRSHPAPAGTIVGAILFSAADQYIYRTGVTMPGSSPFSVFFWVRFVTLRSLTQMMFALLKGDGTQYQGVYLNSGNLLSIQTSNGVTNGSLMEAGKWYCILYTRNGANHNVYVGTETDQMTLALSRSDNNTITVDFAMAASNSVHWINGRMARLRLWNAELTVDEANAERISVTPVRTANIYNAATLNNSAGITDVSGNGFDWTGTGAYNTSVGPTIPSS